MLGEIGQVLLILALLAALLQSVLPLVGAQRDIPALTAIARPAAMLQLSTVLAAFVVLTIAFVRQDFSLRYVADNSNTLLPMIYRYSAVWGAHEGSLLMWSLVLALWTAAVAAFSRQLPPEVMARVLSVMGMISVGFLAFLLFTSNPFARLLPAPGEG
ncbi:MAG: c-type cytochrome biogenesis protein CcmF, partial [Stenotrophomonas sp.]